MNDDKLDEYNELKSFFLHFIRKWKSEKKDAILCSTKEILCWQYNRSLRNDKDDDRPKIVIAAKDTCWG